MQNLVFTLAFKTQTLTHEFFKDAIKEFPSFGINRCSKRPSAGENEETLK